MSHINHIVIPLKGRDVVYLLDDDDFTVYRLNITQNANRSKLKKLIQNSGQRIDVDHKIVDNQPTVTYPHAIKLPVFAYQLSTQNIDNLTQNLLRSTNPSAFTVKKKGNDTTYMDGASKRLDYHRDTHTVSFNNYLGKDSTYQGASLYRHLYKRLTATGTNLDWMRFDSVNEKSRPSFSAAMSKASRSLMSMAMARLSCRPMRMASNAVSCHCLDLAYRCRSRSRESNCRLLQSSIMSCGRLARIRMLLA